MPWNWICYPSGVEHDILAWRTVYSVIEILLNLCHSRQFKLFLTQVAIFRCFRLISILFQNFMLMWNPHTMINELHSIPDDKRQIWEESFTFLIGVKLGALVQFWALNLFQRRSHRINTTGRPWSEKGDVYLRVMMVKDHSDTIYYTIKCSD